MDKKGISRFFIYSRKIQPMVKIIMCYKDGKTKTLHVRKELSDILVTRDVK